MKKKILTLGSIVLMNIVYMHAYAEPVDKGNSGDAPATQSKDASGDEKKENFGWAFSLMLGAGQASIKSNDHEDKVDSLIQGKPSSAKTQTIPAGELSIQYAFNENWSTALTIGEDKNISAKYSFASPISLSGNSDVTAAVGVAEYNYWKNPYKTGSDRSKQSPVAPIYVIGLGGIGPFALSYTTMYQKYDDSELEDVSTDLYGATLTEDERSDLKRPGAVTKYSISTNIPVYENEESGIMIMILGGYDRETKKAAGKSEAYVKPEYNFGLSTGLGDFSLTLQRMWGVKQYEKDNPVFRIKRKDDSSTNIMMAEYKINDHFAVFGRVMQNNTESNINFYDAEMQMMIVGVNMMF